MKKASIVYFSPHGNTRLVAQWIIHFLRQDGMEVGFEDLTGNNREDYNSLDLMVIRRSDLLVLGSPVYANHLPPPIEWLLKSLHGVRAKFAIPFVTYGGVNSGVALAEMGVALRSKGYRVIGAAKILGEHALMFQGVRPLGYERPNEADKGMIEKFTKNILTKMRRSHGREISLSQLRKPGVLNRLFSRTMSLKNFKKMMPRIQIHPQKCTCCGKCLSECPVKAIQLYPQLSILNNCVLCYNCVRICPIGSFQSNLKGVERGLKILSLLNRERPLSQIWW